MAPKSTFHKSHLVVDEEIRAVVERLANEHGESGAAARLGIDRASMLRVIAKRPIRRGTYLMVLEGLAALRSDGRAA